VTPDALRAITCPHKVKTAMPSAYVGGIAAWTEGCSSCCPTALRQRRRAGTAGLVFESTSSLPPMTVAHFDSELIDAFEAVAPPRTYLPGQLISMFESMVTTHSAGVANFAGW
jgi:hypothetical protein